MKDAIEIFEAAHPGKQALFVFDQSSAHASLPPDDLKAFEMNKSDGGKQRKQRDTVIPQSNPSPEHHGKPHSLMGIQKVFRGCLRNAALMVLAYAPNAHQFVQSKTWGVAWLVSLASRKISSTRYQCSRPSFAMQVMSASSCRSFIASSIQ
jgi:hypothetical protein